MPISRQTNSFGFFEQEYINTKKVPHGPTSMSSMMSMSSMNASQGVRRSKRTANGEISCDFSTALPELFASNSNHAGDTSPTPVGSDAVGLPGGPTPLTHSYSNGFFPSNKHASLKVVTEKRMSHLQMKTKRKICSTGSSGAYATRLLYVCSTRETACMPVRSIQIFNHADTLNPDLPHADGTFTCLPPWREIKREATSCACMLILTFGCFER